MAITERVEFESDGLRDSLTGTLAPARFMELLEQEIQVADREKRSITIISLRLASCGHHAERDGELLKSLASHLVRVIRTGDHCARMAEDGFWVIARGDRSAAEIAVSRYLNELEPEQWRVEICEVLDGEKRRNLLRRIDALHFSTEVAQR